MGCDKVVLSFAVRDVDLHHPRVRWAMYCGGIREQITTAPTAFTPAEMAAALGRDVEYTPSGRLVADPAELSEHFLDLPLSPLTTLWAERPVTGVCPPRLARDYRGLNGVDRVNARAAKRERQDKHGKRQEPVAVYYGRLELSRRCVVHLTLEERLDDDWVTLTFNPSRLHDPDGTSLCPVELARGYATALLVWLAEADILVRACPHLDDAGVACTTAVCGCGCDLIGGGRAEAPCPGPYTGLRVCVDPACLRADLPDRAKFNAEEEHRMQGAVAAGKTRQEANRSRRRVPGHLYGARLMRLDLTVDHEGVRDGSVWLAVLRASRHYSETLNMGRDGLPYRDSVRLLTGKTGWQFQGYLKAKEALAKRQGARAKPGTFRFEVTLQAGACKREGLAYLPDVTPERCLELYLKGLAKAGLDRAVGGRPPVLCRNPHGLSKLRTRRLYARLDAVAAGDRLDQSDTTERAYNRDIERLGMVLGLPSRHRLGPYRYLDPVTGTERVPSPEWMQVHDGLCWRRPTPS